MICQVIQSLGYNGLIDIPQLLMILALFAFYEYRKTSPLVYNYFIMVFIYIISYVIVIK